ncbi:uncharacterized protein LOC127780465 [Oryza glaberrima]|uniref:DUF3615 domain-containing protein n=2 Tax=Oryza TaxID=4527 RepID=A0A0D3GP03_9ORYZ|nr:uncharacterized protein LOC127780465 [Oryza glaberrima]
MEDWVMGSESGWTSPAFEELLPQLPRGEQLRLETHLRDRDRRWRRMRYNNAPPPPSSTKIRRQEKERDTWMIPHVQNALRHYNARHPGGEFDVVKPLMQARVVFKGQHWFHINFWARSRSSNKIKRFFAELHYKPLITISGFVSWEQLLPDPLPAPVASVETCTIIEEPLDQYKRSCAFCPAGFGILHPKGDRKFVCGNDKDRFYQKLIPCKQLQFGLPFM